MKTRLVFSTPDLAVARSAMEAARRAGIADEDVLLIARSDIELDEIPDQRKEADSDFMPAAARGIALGGVLGAVGGLIAVVTPIGVTLLGAAAIAAAGAAVGGWASALVGAGLPDPIRQKFEGEIEAGRILVVIDGEGEALLRAREALAAAGASALPFEGLSALR
jgi:hypothetical protein